MVEYEQKYVAKKRVQMMRYIPNDKYTIAWFKLAECVTKGEKEKAFGVYRLLKHSLEDQAYANQLEGDLLSAFADEKAIEKYEHAAQLYYTQNRYKEAAILYEELICNAEYNKQYMVRFIDACNHYPNKDALLKKLIHVTTTLIEQKKEVTLASYLPELEEASPILITVQIYLHMIVQDNLYKIQNNDGIKKILSQAADFLLKHNLNDELTHALASLQALHESWYQFLCSYIGSR